MFNLMALKTLGGAVILRTIETYRLLLVRFWWLLSLVFMAFIMQIPTIRIDILTLVVLMVTIIFLARTSMVRKDWRYVFMGEKTVAFVPLLMIASSIFFSLVAYFGAIIYVLPVLPYCLLVWAYCLLDLPITLFTLPYKIVYSLYQTVKLVLYNLMSLLLFLLLTPLIVMVWLLAWTVPEYTFNIINSVFSLTSSAINYTLYPYMIVLFFPLYAALVAVLYENMRYRTEVQ